MAYPHSLYEVIMTSRFTQVPSAFTAVSGTQEWQGIPPVSDASSPSTVGVALYSPMFFPVKVHACGVRFADVAAGVSIARDFTFRRNPSNGPSAVGAATDNILILGVPAGGFGATAAAGGLNRVVYRKVTSSIIVQPGTWIKVLATGVVSGVNPQFGLLLSPAWEGFENITQMVSSVT